MQRTRSASPTQPLHFPIRRTSRWAIAVIALATLCLGHAHAAEPAASPPAKSPPTAASVEPAPGPATSGASTGGAAPAAGDDFNFDLLGDSGGKPAAAPSPEVKAQAERIERQGRIRRPMLTSHQAFGFAALAVLTATVVIGHLNYYDMYQSGDQTGRYRAAHLGLSIGTSTLFGTTGLLAVFAPNPYPKPIRFDTALVHKVAMILATAGMVTQVILGPITVERIGRTDQSRLALGHVITGYATWAFMTTGMFAYLF